MQTRVLRVAESLPRSSPVFLYDHVDQTASTVGILPRHSRVYVTSGLIARITDQGLKGILAHENTHVRECHIFVTFLYACGYAFLAHVTDSTRLFLFGFLGFMALRRYLEYRADAGGAHDAGRDTMLTGLRELHTMYPTKRWSRWFVFAAPYPTIPMRIRALETGRFRLF
jgi:Zn-dependent protease with chaperone function